MTNGIESHRRLSFVKHFPSHAVTLPSHNHAPILITLHLCFSSSSCVHLILRPHIVKMDPKAPHFRHMSSGSSKSDLASVFSNLSSSSATVIPSASTSSGSSTQVTPGDRQAVIKFEPRSQVSVAEEGSTRRTSIDIGRVMTSSSALAERCRSRVT